MGTANHTEKQPYSKQHLCLLWFIYILFWHIRVKRSRNILPRCVGGRCSRSCIYITFIVWEHRLCPASQIFSSNQPFLILPKSCGTSKSTNRLLLLLTYIITSLLCSFCWTRQEARQTHLYIQVFCF